MYHGDLIKLIEARQKQLLLCGGAAGHLQHLFDNKELTFGEIKEVLRNAAEGKLEKASEKLDGMNLVFTVADGELKVARSGGDIRGGGMDAAGLAKKFFGRGNIEQAFNSAFKVLSQALGSLGPGDTNTAFDGGRRWYSMEVVYASEPNTINYDSNSIVFHGWPIFEVQDDGSVKQTDDGGIKLLTQRIDQMQKAVSAKDWRVRGPSLLNLKKIGDGSALGKAISQIDAAMAPAGMDDSSTVYDFLRAKFAEDIGDLGLPKDAARAVVERCAGAPGSPNVNDIRKITPKDKQKEMQDFVRASEELAKRHCQPIEQAIQDFAVEVLRGVHSTLIAGSDEEVARLRAQLTKAIKAIESSGNDAAMDVLQKEMSRLRSVDNVSAAMEGIVFFYKGQAYKFTGAFAPAHQILSLFKYGRKGIPKMDMGEVVLRSSLGRLLREGGHAFDDVQPISLRDFKRLWPRIRDDLHDLGVDDVEPIGSTGKKQLMGDVDLAGRFDGSRDDLLQLAGDVLGHGNVARVGANIVSMRYRDGDKRFQVDLMLGDPGYLRWSRYGTSPEKEHPEHSPVKGAVRNVLLNTINSIAARKAFPGKQTDLDRVRYSVDFDRGLYRVVQTKRNATPGKPPTKDWKTVTKELVSDDPDGVVRAMFGKGFKASDLRTFEDVVGALERSPQLNDLADEIMKTFASDMRQVAVRSPKVLGDDPDATLAYIDRVAGAG